MRIFQVLASVFLVGLLLAGCSSNSNPGSSSHQDQKSQTTDKSSHTPTPNKHAAADKNSTDNHKKRAQKSTPPKDGDASNQDSVAKKQDQTKKKTQSAKKNAKKSEDNNNKKASHNEHQLQQKKYQSSKIATQHLKKSAKNNEIDLDNAFKSSKKNVIDLGHNVKGNEGVAAGSYLVDWTEGRWAFSIKGPSGSDLPANMAHDMVAYLAQHTLPVPHEKGYIRVFYADKKTPEDFIASWQEHSTIYTLKLHHIKPVEALKVVISYRSKS